LLAADHAIPEQVVSRFENQNQLALELAAELPDDQTVAALEQIRDQARLQEQAMTKLNVQDQTAQLTHARIQAMLQTQDQIAQQGIQDPDWLRQQLRLHDRKRIQLSTPTVLNNETEQTPVSGSNPGTTGTPAPGSGFGAGSADAQNPWTDGTPTPGSGYGNGQGTGECSTCTPDPKNGNPTQQPGSGNGNSGTGSGIDSGNGSGSSDGSGTGSGNGDGSGTGGGDSSGGGNGGHGKP
jgi:hypothetical protein